MNAMFLTAEGAEGNLEYGFKPVTINAMFFHHQPSLTNVSYGWQAACPPKPWRRWKENEDSEKT
jgi:hypothetical protein